MNENGDKCVCTNEIIFYDVQHREKRHKDHHHEHHGADDDDHDDDRDDDRRHKKHHYPTPKPSHRPAPKEEQPVPTAKPVHEIIIPVPDLSPVHLPPLPPVPAFSKEDIKPIAEHVIDIIHGDGEPREPKQPEQPEQPEPVAGPPIATAKETPTTTQPAAGAGAQAAHDAVKKPLEQLVTETQEGAAAAAAAS